MGVRFPEKCGFHPPTGLIRRLRNACSPPHRSKVQTEKIANGEAEFTAAQGTQVAIQFAAQPVETKVCRDGQAHDWAEHAKHLYLQAGYKPAIVEQAWLGDTTTVRAGNALFTSTVDEKGRATFRNERPSPRIYVLFTDNPLSSV